MKWVKRSDIKVDRVAYPGLFNDFLTRKRLLPFNHPRRQGSRAMDRGVVISSS